MKNGAILSKKMHPKIKSPVIGVNLTNLINLMLKKILIFLLLAIASVASLWLFYPEDMNIQSAMLYQKLTTQKIFQKPKVALRPFKGIDDQTVNEVKSAIEEYYGFETTILPTVDLPEDSRTTNIPGLKYYNPSPYRFRADTLLRFLRRELPGEYDYCLGTYPYGYFNHQKKEWQNQRTHLDVH